MWAIFNKSVYDYEKNETAFFSLICILLRDLSHLIQRCFLKYSLRGKISLKNLSSSTLQAVHWAVQMIFYFLIKWDISTTWFQIWLVRFASARCQASHNKYIALISVKIWNDNFGNYSYRNRVVPAYGYLDEKLTKLTIC